MILIGLGVGCVQAQTRKEEESKVLALEFVWGSAAHLRDTKALSSIFDDSLVYVPIDGRLMTKAQVLADTAAASPVDIIVQSFAARSHGNVVIVTGVLQLRSVEQGKRMIRYGRFLDTWVLKNDQWVCVVSMTTSVRK